MNNKQYADLQINGYMGVDFSAPDLTEEQFLTAADNIFKSGTNYFLPTIVTSSKEVYLHNLVIISNAVKKHGLTENITGVHLEGPFISRAEGAVGAHIPEFVKEPDTAFFDELMECSEGFIKLITVAAELNGITEFISHVSSCGVTVSCGHQLASSKDLQKAAKAGAKLLTHLGNGCPNKIDRHNNMIWSGMANDDLTAMIIADGHHLPFDAVKCIIRCKGVDKVIITSDAAPVAGFPPGKYKCWNNDAVLEPDGKFHNPEKECLVGSSVCMRQCAEYLESHGFSEEDIDIMTIHNPMKIIRNQQI